MIGTYLGSAESVLYLGEYAAFYWTHHIAVDGYSRTPFPLKEEYLGEIQRHALTFAQNAAARRGAAYFCDSTPWNLRVADALAAHEDAIFVLVMRHYAGVLQSMQRSFSDGYRFVGRTERDRALLWADSYANAVRLPRDRLVCVSYERLCASPEATLGQFRIELAALGFPASTLRDSELTKSHATIPGKPRPTLAILDPAGEVRFQSIPSFDAVAWYASSSGRDIEDVVSPTDRLLREAFPCYCSPDGWRGA
jgi:sulfotransferase family protein